MNDQFSCVIVGAGFAGAVCAERLASAGKRVLLIDKRAHIGGNAYDEYDDAGILVSRYGAHIFHTNSRDVFEYLSRFTGWRPYEHRVLSNVNGRLLPVPINQTTLEAFGGDEAAARDAMVVPYTWKQWGEYADELAPTVLARIATRANRDDRYFTDTFQAMPAQGYTRLFERMLDHPNITICLNTPYMRYKSGAIAPEDWRQSDLMYTLRHSGPIRWDLGCWGQPTLIYSSPIDEFFDYCYGRLPYRSAAFRFETLDAERYQPVGVVNYPSADVPYTRIAEFKHLTGQIHQKTTIAYEYPQADGEPFWPVPTAASAALYKRYEDLARFTPGVHFVGRLGTFRYYDIHQVVAQALTLSVRLLAKEVPCPI